MPVVPYNISMAPVTAGCSTVECRSHVKHMVVFGALHGRTCDLIKEFLGCESRLLHCRLVWCETRSAEETLGFSGSHMPEQSCIPTALQALPGCNLSLPAGQAVHRIGDDISRMGLAATLIAGWRDVKAFPVPLMQGRQHDAGCKQVSMSVSSTST